MVFKEFRVRDEHVVHDTMSVWFLALASLLLLTYTPCPAIVCSQNHAPISPKLKFLRLLACHHFGKVIGTDFAFVTLKTNCDEATLAGFLSEKSSAGNTPSYLRHMFTSLQIA